MDVESLEQALPAFTASALEGCEEENVLVADEPENVRKPTLHVVWTFDEELNNLEGSGLGRPMHALRYTAVIRDPAATQTQRRMWAQEIRAAFHLRRPFEVAGFDHSEVLRFSVDPDETRVGIAGNTGGAEAQVDVLFVGDVLAAETEEPEEE